MTYPHTYQEGQEYMDEDFGDLSQVDESDRFTPIEPGRYTLMATRIELKPTKTGGKMIAVEFQVANGPNKGRLIFENYNIQHSNHQTVEIAQRQIKQWIMACGADANQRLTMVLLRPLEGVEFSAEVGIQVDKTGQYGDSNRIKRYLLPDDRLPWTQSKPKSYPHPPQQQPRPSARPWEKK